MLIDNQWALTRALKAGLSQLFALIAGLRGEEDRAVLDAISDPISWLITHAVPDDQMGHFQQFVRAFFQPLFEQLGWEVRPDETAEEREKRARVIGILGRIAGVPEIQAEARRPSRRTWTARCSSTPTSPLPWQAWRPRRVTPRSTTATWRA